MGDAQSCCAARDKEFKNVFKMEQPGCVLTAQLASPTEPVSSITYMDWQEVVALSRAIAPGGKLLGLASTKQMVATLQGQHTIQIFEIRRDNVTENLTNDTALQDGLKHSQKPILQNVGVLYASALETLTCVRFLDSAHPRFIAVGTSKVHSGAALGEHYVALWRIRPCPPVAFQSEGTPSLESFTDEKKAEQCTCVPAGQLQGHSAPIACLRTVCDLLVSCDDHGEMRLWRWLDWAKIDWRRVSRRRRSRSALTDNVPCAMPAFECVWSTKAHQSGITGLVISHFGEVTPLRVYTASVKGCVKVWELIGIGGSCGAVAEKDTVTANVVQELDCSARGMCAVCDLALSVSPNAKLAPLRSENGSGNAMRHSWGLSRSASSSSLGVTSNPACLFVSGKTRIGMPIIHVWDLRIGMIQHTLTGHTGEIESVAFGPFSNGPLLSASRDGTIKVWDHHSGECLRTLYGHDAAVLALVIEPNQRIWSADEAGCIAAHEL